MRISYLRLLPIIFTFQIVVGQKESIPSNWGIHVGYATQQAFPFKDKDNRKAQTFHFAISCYFLYTVLCHVISFVLFSIVGG